MAGPQAASKVRRSKSGLDTRSQPPATHFAADSTTPNTMIALG